MDLSVAAPVPRARPVLAAPTRRRGGAGPALPRISRCQLRSPGDEQQPLPGEPFDDDVYVRAWWQRFEYLHGTEHDDGAAHELDWAETGVRDRIWHGDPTSAVWLLDASGAVPETVAFGPPQELLEDRGPEIEQDVAGLCASQLVRRRAVAAVVLDDGQRRVVPALARYLA